MKHINNLDITKRCGYKPTDKVSDFLDKITNKQFQEKMRYIISWKDSDNIHFKAAGIDAELKYTPYLNSKIKDIPENILEDYSHYWYTDGKNYYLYRPCCN